MEWLMGLSGGLMIGAAAAMFLLINGRIMGISGVFGGLLDGTGRENTAERGGFVIGLIALPALMVQWWPSHTHITGNWPILVLGGALVGLGTRMANGCTSGHGVCGMSRLSPRSILAMALSVGAGVACMAVMRHLLGVI
ncbi:MAG: YeeE/YedE family protein [Alphaproteobacteria bacterium]